MSKQYRVIRSFYVGDELVTEETNVSTLDKAVVEKALADGNIAEAAEGAEVAPSTPSVEPPAPVTEPTPEATAPVTPLEDSSSTDSDPNGEGQASLSTEAQIAQDLGLDSDEQNPEGNQPVVVQ